MFSFFDGLLSPILNDLPPRPADEDEQVTQPVLDHGIKPTTPPDAARCCQCTRAVPTICRNAHGLTRGHALACIGANSSSAHHHTPTRGQLHLPRELRTSPQISEDEDTNDGSNEDANSPARPIHDVSYLPSYPSESTSLGLIRNGRGGGNSAMLILDEAAHPPIAFSAGLPGGIQLSQLPHSWCE